MKQGNISFFLRIERLMEVIDLSSYIKNRKALATQRTESGTQAKAQRQQNAMMSSRNLKDLK